MGETVFIFTCASYSILQQVSSNMDEKSSLVHAICMFSCRLRRWTERKGLRGGFRLRLRECINHELYVVAQGIENGAGAAAAVVLFDFGAHFVGRTTGGDALDQFVRHKLHGLMDLFLSRGPAEDGLHLLDGFRRGAAGLGDMRLLREVLCNQFFSGLHRAVVIVIYRTHD